MGKIIVICGMTGCGKTTLLSRALAEIHNLEVITAVTTRSPRNKAFSGLLDKKCLSKKEFLKLLADNKLCCINKVYDEYYAFLKDDFAKASDNRSIILEYKASCISDIKDLYPLATCIYIFPKTLENIYQALEDRNNAHQRIQNDIEEYYNVMNKAHPLSQFFDFFFENAFDDNSIYSFIDLIATLCN